MKNSTDAISNRTSDLPACNEVPQPTEPPHNTPSKQARFKKNNGAASRLPYPNEIIGLK